MSKHEKIREDLLVALEKHGQQKTVEIFREKFKPLCQQAVDREIIVQILANLGWLARTTFLIIYPEYTIHYIFRIRAKP
ncbi:MAG: hypothetical protein WCX70_02960 [Candidatus Paceibacterota bacterium]|jgi:hypothetical protein